MESAASFNISNADLLELLTRIQEFEYAANQESDFCKNALAKCIKLWELDYKCEVINNENGKICSSYPSKIIIPKCDKSSVKKLKLEDDCKSEDVDKVQELMMKSSIARARYRCPVPAILFDDKYVMRSATLGIWIDSALKSMAANTKAVEENKPQDKDLLIHFNTKNIMDLMVEEQKKFLSSYIRVCSSEKIEGEYIEDFKIWQLPFPGCEFFEEFSKQNYDSEKLHFNFDDPNVEVELNIPDSLKDLKLKVSKDWDNYKKWDLRKLTSNYLKFVLAHLKEIFKNDDSRSSGVLVHCISGWDRTPLFVSLIRIVLWAEGYIHKSLDVYQILYLVIAYDWYLFGHKLPTRLRKNENIFYFCFEFLITLIHENTPEDEDIPPSSNIPLEEKESENLKVVKEEEDYALDCPLESSELNESFDILQENIPPLSVSPVTPPLKDESPIEELLKNVFKRSPLQNVNPPISSERVRRLSKEENLSSKESSLSPEEKTKSRRKSGGSMKSRHSPSKHSGHSEQLDNLGEGEIISPPKASATMPIEIPCRRRSRNDSVCSSGSWAILNSPTASQIFGSLEEKFPSDVCSRPNSIRNTRLKRVRKLFYKLYGEVPLKRTQSWGELVSSYVGY